MRAIEVVKRYSKAFKQADPYSYYLDEKSKADMVLTVATMTKQQKAMLEQIIELLEMYQDNLI